MLKKDEIIQKLKTLIGLTQPGDGDEQLEIHLENVALELSQEFASLVTRSVTITSVGTVVTFPDYVSSIVGIWIGNKEVQPVDAATFQVAQTGGFLNDVIYIEERAGKWVGTLSGTSVTNTAVTAIYKLSVDDIGLFPDYYRRLIMLGATRDYLLWDDMEDMDKESKFKARYMEALGVAREMQTHNTGLDVRRESQFELDWNRALRTILVTNDRDVGT